MNDTINIISLFLDASLTVQGIIILLLIFSILSWMIIFERWALLSKAEEEFQDFEYLFWSDIEIDKVYDIGSEKEINIVGAEYLFRTGFHEYRKMLSEDLSPDIIMEGLERSLQSALRQEESILHKNLPFLATVASVSPYIGLFGTVWGIMNSFIGLAEASQATLASVAPGISEALVATAVGLFAAIPAQIAYNRFSVRSENLITFYLGFIDEFSSVLYRETHKNI